MVNFQSPLISLNSVRLILYFVFKKTDRHIFTLNISKQLCEESTRKNYKASSILLITDGACSGLY